MRGYAFVDKSCGNVNQIISWGDDRNLPSNYPKLDNEDIKVISNYDPHTFNDYQAYNSTTGKFTNKLTLNADKSKINHTIDETNITITYPVPINEAAHLFLDGQLVNINIEKGKAIIPFSSQVIGTHQITVESTSTYGRNFISIEVI